jgi:hypothetical protein
MRWSTPARQASPAPTVTAADTLLMGAPQQSDSNSIAGAVILTREYDEADTYVATSNYDESTA